MSKIKLLTPNTQYSPIHFYSKCACFNCLPEHLSILKMRESRTHARSKFTINGFILD